MRILLSICLVITIFLAGCAHEGVIVQKTSSALPLYHSVGVEGSYAFLLRDRSGIVHRQIVTPQVFERYAIGEYFNDLQPAPAQQMGDGKTMRAAQTQPVVTAPMMAWMRKTEKKPAPVATRKAATPKRVAQRAKASVPATKRVAQQPAVKAAPIQTAPRLASVNQPEVRFFMEARCR